MTVRAHLHTCNSFKNNELYTQKCETQLQTFLIHYASRDLYSPPLYFSSQVEIQRGKSPTFVSVHTVSS